MITYKIKPDFVGGGRIKYGIYYTKSFLGFPYLQDLFIGGFYDTKEQAQEALGRYIEEGGTP